MWKLVDYVVACCLVVGFKNRPTNRPDGDPFVAAVLLTLALFITVIFPMGMAVVLLIDNLIFPSEKYYYVVSAIPVFIGIYALVNHCVAHRCARESLSKLSLRQKELMSLFVLASLIVPPALLAIGIYGYQFVIGD